MATKNDMHDWLLQNHQSMVPVLRKELLRQGQQLIAAMRAKTDDQTGTLDKSIRMEEGRDELTIVIKAGGELTTKNGYDYAVGKEFGTQKMPAEPFFWPSYRENKPRFQKAMNTLVYSFFQRVRQH